LLNVADWTFNVLLIIHVEFIEELVQKQRKPWEAERKFVCFHDLK